MTPRPGSLAATRAHASHDLELVAAHAAGDATGADLETATALVARCSDCSALHRDLRAIAAALPAMPAPRRTRDFRISPEQAAALRPGGWRRLVRAFAGPGFRFAAPLGTGLATLGIAGLLLGSLAGTPLGAGSAPAPQGDRNFGAAPETSGGMATPGDEVAIQGEASLSPASSGGRTTALGPAAEPTPIAEPGAQAAEPGAKVVQPHDRAPAPLLALASAVAVAIGVMLIAVRVLGRRLAQAP